MNKTTHEIRPGDMILDKTTDEIGRMMRNLAEESWETGSFIGAFEFT